MLIEVENDDGTWSVLNRANHGQNLQEVMLMARWRATQMLGTARIRVVDEWARE